MTPPSQSRDGTAIAIPTVKQHLASLRMLFDWPITGQVIDADPAAAVCAQPRREEGGKRPSSKPTRPPQIKGSPRGITPVRKSRSEWHSVKRKLQIAKELSQESPC